MTRPLPNVLFLCTGNSCRSQMAEGWARALRAGDFVSCSAGTSPHGLNPLAVRVMAEAGVDISTHASKTPAQALESGRIDLVVTVCDHAAESCPRVPELAGVPAFHAPFDDPPRLARDARSEEEALAHYRRVRDEIASFIRTLNAPLLPR